MKKIILSAFVVSILISGCNNGNNSQSNIGGYTIHGTTNSIDNGWVYLQHEDSANTFIQDSAKIENHAFTFTGKVSDPWMYFIWAGNGATIIDYSGRTKSNPNALSFFLEDTTIQINIKDTINKGIVSGSHSNDMYLAYKKLLVPFDLKEKSVDSTYEEVCKNKDKAALDSIEKTYTQIYKDFDKEKDNAIIAYAEQNPTSVFSAWTISKNMLYVPDLDAFKKVYGSFSPTVQGSVYGKKIKKAIDLAERVAIGNPALDFTMNDTAGTPVSLSSFRGKYVVLDFWASWCHPCRHENPYIVAAYNKYKNKNFTVLSVSLDNQKQAWLKAIHDDGLTWTHVSDLKLWKNAVASMYGIKSIPTNFLLDPDGKIIGRNLMNEDLDKTLAKVLK